MPHSFRTRFLALVGVGLSLALVQSCQASRSPFLPSPRFELNAATTGVTSLGAASAPREVGRLTVVVKAADLVRRARRLLATVADVEQVIVKVTTAGGAEFLATVTKSQLSGPSASVTFNAVPVGPVTITMTAYDAAGQAIGTVTQPSTVQAGTTTPVDLTLTLDPTIVQASPGPSGGGGAPSTGGIAVNGSLVDGPVVVSPSPSASPSSLPSGTVLSYPLPSPLEVSGLVVRPDRMVWLGEHYGGFGLDQGGALFRFDLATQKLDRFKWADHWGTGNLKSRAGSGAWYTSGGKIYGVDANANQELSFSYSSNGNGGSVLVDRQGNLWTTTFDVVNKYSPSGVLLKTYTVPKTNMVLETSTLALDANDQVWVSFSYSTTGHEVHLLDSEAQLVRKFSVSTFARPRFADPQGHVWVDLQGTLTKFTPTGQSMATLPLDVNAEIDRQGNLWLHRGDKLDQYDSSGVFVRSLAIPANDYEDIYLDPTMPIVPTGLLVIDPDGHLWSVYQTIENEGTDSQQIHKTLIEVIP